MEFLKALEEAKSSGVDVKTFSLIWKMEAESKLLPLGSSAPSSPGHGPSTTADSAPPTCESNERLSDPHIPTVEESMMCVTSELSSLKQFCQDMAADVGSLKKLCQTVSSKQQTVTGLCKQMNSHLDKIGCMYEVVSTDTKKVKELCSKITRDTDSYKGTLTSIYSYTKSTHDLCSKMVVSQKDMISQCKGIAETQKSLKENCDQKLAGQKEMKETFQKAQSQPQTGEETPDKTPPADTYDISIRKQLEAILQAVHDLEKNIISWQQNTAHEHFDQVANDRKSIQKTFQQFRSDIGVLRSDFRKQQGQWPDMLSSCVRDVTRNEQNSLLDRLSQLENSLADFSVQQQKALGQSFEALVENPLRKMLNESKQFMEKLFKQAKVCPAADDGFSSKDCSQKTLRPDKSTAERKKESEKESESERERERERAREREREKESKEYVTTKSDSAKKSQSNPMNFVDDRNQCRWRIFHFKHLARTQFLLKGPSIHVAGFSFRFYLTIKKDMTFVLALKSTNEDQFEQVKSWPLVLNVVIELIDDIKTGETEVLCKKEMSIQRKPCYHDNALWIDDVAKLRLFPHGEKNEVWLRGSVYYLRR
ncbi:E3 ubiquitin-protein ligase BRE1A [Aplysia californica]|uniref:E3 ubiquitin-protein ligase BRE1A n=1 Tax=Aplysia californica TaxID=6500 RepID=A0ABM0K903_APLCA|nr:E3 ubiquitin-protein ligase BRE1A [Aplysia californica]XP_035829173.1 E3 ubiquitin-protein ligase BRE1A [Aplysia californica]